ncbi:MAG: hypothetical protein KJ902_01580, partial [Candidatus Omnitrophica bacterium]|nr:hypothetical protein [Candidatus Omnitrophota bacterium]
MRYKLLTTMVATILIALLPITAAQGAAATPGTSAAQGPVAAPSNGANAAATVAAPSNGANAAAKMIMVFYSPGCNECREIMDNFLPEIKQKYKDKIMVVDYNIENMESYSFLLSLQDKYDEKSKGGFYNPKPPILFIEDILLYGAKETKNRLEGII